MFKPSGGSEGFFMWKRFKLSISVRAKTACFVRFLWETIIINNMCFCKSLYILTLTAFYKNIVSWLAVKRSWVRLPSSLPFLIGVHVKWAFFGLSHLRRYLRISLKHDIPELTEDEYDSIPPPLLAKSNDGSP